jgi:hypothetical protein
MYTRFLESLFESQTYPNENENDPLGNEVRRTVSNVEYYIFDLL